MKTVLASIFILISNQIFSQRVDTLQFRLVQPIMEDSLNYYGEEYEFESYRIYYSDSTFSDSLLIGPRGCNDCHKNIFMKVKEGKWFISNCFGNQLIMEKSDSNYIVHSFNISIRGMVCNAIWKDAILVQGSLYPCFSIVNPRQIESDIETYLFSPVSGIFGILGVDNSMLICNPKSNLN